MCKIRNFVAGFGVVAMLAFYSSVAASAVTVLSFQDFESPALPSTGNWGFGSQGGGAVSISTDTTQNFNHSAGSIKGSYPAPVGDLYVWGGYDISALNLNDVYIDFWARMPSAKKHGLKFLKIFGQRNGSNYANTTFGLDYTGVNYGGMYAVSFGDGSSIGNDTANVINFDGTYPSWIGRSYGKATVATPQKALWSSSNWSDTWHHFKIHVKFNTGTLATNEVADGAYYVEIDGKVYVDATGLFNRNYSNGPIQKISFFDWSQGGTVPFEIWYDDIRITTGGFYSVAPMPPANATFK